MRPLPKIALVITPKGVFELYDAEGILIARAYCGTFYLDARRDAREEIKREIAEFLGVRVSDVDIMWRDSYAQD